VREREREREREIISGNMKRICYPNYLQLDAYIFASTTASNFYECKAIPFIEKSNFKAQSILFVFDILICMFFPFYT
jgi:hypothetical protein